jgi:AcrR family transcriptional regulator
MPGELTQEWRGEPLPRGRHKLDPKTVKSSQRERLLRAMLESVGERGYQATTVSQVAAAARVSPNTFYEFFADKLDCFIALCDEEARGLLDAALVGASAPTWREAVRRGVAEYLRWWQDRPAFSRAYLLELPAAGRPAFEQRIRASRPFAEMFRGLAVRARAEEPELPAPPKLGPDLLIVGVIEIVAREVGAGRADRLQEMSADLEALIITLLSSGDRPAQAT